MILDWSKMIISMHSIRVQEQMNGIYWSIYFNLEKITFTLASLHVTSNLQNSQDWIATLTLF